MRKGRYNVQLPLAYGNVIKKFNVYMNDACVRFIYFEGEYIPISRKQHYKGGWLWQFKYSEERKNKPKYKLVDYRSDGWFITYGKGRVNVRDYQPLYNIAFINGEYKVEDNTQHYVIEDKEELHDYLLECMAFLRKKYPKGKD